MKASDRSREAAADTRHTQEVEMQSQQGEKCTLIQREWRQSMNKGSQESLQEGESRPSGVLFQQREEKKKT